MALSSKTGGIAAAVGLLATAGTVVSALAKPEVSACVATVFSAFGTHAAAIGTAIVGAIGGGATLMAYFSHAPGTQPTDTKSNG